MFFFLYTWEIGVHIETSVNISTSFVVQRVVVFSKWKRTFSIDSKSNFRVFTIHHRRHRLRWWDLKNKEKMLNIEHWSNEKSWKKHKNKGRKMIRADHLSDCRSFQIQRDLRWMFRPRILTNRCWQHGFSIGVLHKHANTRQQMHNIHKKNDQMSSRKRRRKKFVQRETNSNSNQLEKGRLNEHAENPFLNMKLVSSYHVETRSQL